VATNRRGLGFAAAAALPAVVDHLAGFRAIAQAFEGDGRVNHVAGQAPAGLVIVGSNRLALENREARMDPIPHNLDQAPESVLALVALVPDALELVEVVLDQAIPRRGLGIPRLFEFALLLLCRGSRHQSAAQPPGDRRQAAPPPLRV
jgi:hypothetical protein